MSAPNTRRRSTMGQVRAAGAGSLGRQPPAPLPGRARLRSRDWTRTDRASQRDRFKIPGLAGVDHRVRFASATWADLLGADAQTIADTGHLPSTNAPGGGGCWWSSWLRGSLGLVGASPARRRPRTGVAHNLRARPRRHRPPAMSFAVVRRAKAQSWTVFPSSMPPPSSQSDLLYSSPARRRSRPWRRNVLDSFSSGRGATLWRTLSVRPKVRSDGFVCSN